MRILLDATHAELRTYFIDATEFLSSAWYLSRDSVVVACMENHLNTNTSAQIKDGCGNAARESSVRRVKAAVPILSHGAAEEDLMMRLKLVKTVLGLALLANIVIWHRIWKLFAAPGVETQPVASGLRTTESPQKLHRRLARLVTVVVRQFESFENDVAATVESVVNAFAAMPVLVVCDEPPYPPLELDLGNESMKNVRLVDLRPGLNKSYETRNPMFYVRTKFVLFLPDAVRLSTKQAVQGMIARTAKLGAVAVPIGTGSLGCVGVGLKEKEWSLRLTNVDGTECDAVVGRHVTMIEAKILRKLSDPFLLPFTDALYIQTTAIGTKVHIMKEHRFNEGKPLFRSHQAQWRAQQLHQSRERQMFDKFGMKKVTRASGSVEWYGCSRETARCFGPVVNGVPSYLYENRYTPPCCLAGLRRVAHHVFDKLEEAGIRFWLEAGSLLGAMRNGDILPWSHEVDVGLNRDDIGRSPWLAKARSKPVKDGQGFVWEKATEGEFFKIQYSKANRLHVNLLPFFARNGTMRRDAWFLGNRDFPEQFLHPMSSIEFGGRQVPSPNNIRDFLEMKYFKGVIENPELPGKLSFK